MDIMDEEIIKILKRDSRESYVNIAEMLKTSEGTIRSRVKKLYESGIITQFTIKTVGKNVKALVEIKIERIGQRCCKEREHNQHPPKPHSKRNLSCVH